ncbi:hypothetical protein [Leptolyngbya sp. KIOST-1]|uniref:hypothetical protein n=1 Tax=Leptolyngbya sp. KIOST-1 TaxID=1229172 RepID=UPI00056D7717|nr:hypothetical protein [Leptolyngbya sp. KIOST-1]
MTYEFQLPVRNQELVRLIAIGDHGAVRDTIHQLGALGYADPDRWSKLTPTGREDEYLAIHTRRYAPAAE